MSKKYIALFLAFCVILTGFAACKKAYKYGIIITDSDGKTRVLATDDNGKAMTDEANNIIIIVTQANGDPVKDNEGNMETQKVGHPDYYVADNVVEGEKFSVKIPDGWKQSTAPDVRLTNIETGGEINFLVKKGQYINNVIVSAEQFMNAAEEQDPTAEIVVKDVKLCGVDATKYEYNSAKNASAVTFYIFEKNGTVFLFQAAISNKYKDLVDFEAVMNSVEFK